MNAALRPQHKHSAAVLIAPGRVQLRELDVPKPAADAVRIRMQGCGVCASGLPVWEGRPWFEYPLEPGSPGHEGWGVVDALGSNVHDLEQGDRVAVVSYRAFAQFDVAPRAAVVKLPAQLDGRAFPGEPLGCAMNIFERGDIRAGMSVAIVGGGFLGVLLTQLATRAGATVVVLSRRECSRRQSLAAGAVAVVDATDGVAAGKHAHALSCGCGFDRVIEAAGVQAALDLASAVTAEHGRLVIAGYHQDGLRQVDMQSWNWRGLDVVNAHERKVERYAAGIHAAIDAVLDGRLDPFPLLTHMMPLAALGEAFELARIRPAGFMKACVMMEDAA